MIEQPHGAWAQSARLAFQFIISAVVVLACGWLVSNVHQVPSDSRAVVVRLGQVAKEHGPGLLIAWPRPIDEVVLVPSLDSQIALAIEPHERPGGSSADRPAASHSRMFDGFPISSVARENGSFLMTGDFSVVHLEATLFYQITHPRGYVLTRDFLRSALTRLYNASVIGVAAGRELDAVLVARPETAGASHNAHREKFRSELVAAINQRLSQLAGHGTDLGIRITRVDLSPSIPRGAKGAFDYVLVAAQRAEEGMAYARTNAELSLQKAHQQVDQIAAQAEAEAQERIQEALRRTVAIASLSRDHASTPSQVLERRLYHERIKAILGKAARIDTVDRDSAARAILSGAPGR